MVGPEGDFLSISGFLNIPQPHACFLYRKCISDVAALLINLDLLIKREYTVLESQF